MSFHCQRTLRLHEAIQWSEHRVRTLAVAITNRHCDLQSFGSRLCLKQGDAEIELNSYPEFFKKVNIFHTVNRFHPHRSVHGSVYGQPSSPHGRESLLHGATGSSYSAWGHVYPKCCSVHDILNWKKAKFFIPFLVKSTCPVRFLPKSLIFSYRFYEHINKITTVIFSWKNSDPFDQACLDRFVLQLRSDGAVSAGRWDEAYRITGWLIWFFNKSWPLPWCQKKITEKKTFWKDLGMTLEFFDCHA